MNEIRLLQAREIECRIQQVKKGSGVSLLLYKDARCDMAILDEVFGPANWQRKHELIDGKLYCSVGIKYDGEWVWKQDVGTESNTEKEKGQASDSFKRACFNVGIGRELYTAPFIWIPDGNCNISESNGRTYCNDRFNVTKVNYNDHREIIGLTIENAKNHKIVYTYGNVDDVAATPVRVTKVEKIPEPPKQEEEFVCESCGKVIEPYTCESGKTMTPAQIVEKSKRDYRGTYCPTCMMRIKQNTDGHH